MRNKTNIEYNAQTINSVAIANFNRDSIVFQQINSKRLVAQGFICAMTNPFSNQIADIAQSITTNDNDDATLFAFTVVEDNYGKDRFAVWVK